MELRLLPGELCICRLAPDAPWPPVPSGARLFSVTRTPAETSVVCDAHAAPPGARVEAGWRAIEVSGPLDFSLVGVVASLAVPLADAAVSVFVMSTFDTDYVLVRAQALDSAVAALSAAGHRVQDGGPAE